jgi:hypothetical protein
MHYRSNPRSHHRVKAHCLIAASRLPSARVLRFPSQGTGKITAQTPGQVPSGNIATHSGDVIVGRLQNGFQWVGHNLAYFFGIHLAKVTFRIYKFNGCSKRVLMH